MLKNNVKRESGVELLKIIAMFAIVISHTIYTISMPNGLIETNEYVVDLVSPASSVQFFILKLLSNLGG